MLDHPNYMFPSIDAKLNCVIPWMQWVSGWLPGRSLVHAALSIWLSIMERECMDIKEIQQKVGAVWKGEMSKEWHCEKHFDAFFVVSRATGFDGIQLAH